MVKIAPLNSSFMAVSMIGLIISAVYILPEVSYSWGFTFTVFFIITFIASIISMVLAEPREDDIDHFR